MLPRCLKNVFQHGVFIEINKIKKNIAFSFEIKIKYHLTELTVLKMKEFYFENASFAATWVYCIT